METIKRNRDGLGEQEFLERYDPGDYERPSVTVDMLIFGIGPAAYASGIEENEEDIRLLLIRRADHPCIGQWALPGGFVNMDEDLEAAARRELAEETGVEDVFLEQVHTWGDVGRDPRTRIISISYMAVVDPETAVVRSGDDAADARWFTVNLTRISEKREQLEKGFKQEAIYNLQLRTDDEILDTVVRKVRTTIRRIDQIKWEVIRNGGVAFDHAQAICCSLERLSGKNTLNDCPPL